MSDSASANLRPTNLPRNLPPRTRSSPCPTLSRIGNEPAGAVPPGFVGRTAGAVAAVILPGAADAIRTVVTIADLAAASPSIVAVFTRLNLRVFLLSLWWGGLSLALLLATLQSDLGQVPTQDTPAPKPTKGVFLTFSRPKTNSRSWWVAPAAVDLANGLKSTGEEREERLSERIRLASEGPVQVPYVEQSSGVTVVRTEGQILATVLPEDLPEYAVRLKDDSRKALEKELADHWARIIQAELEHRRWRSTPEYQFGLIRVYLLMLLLGASLHQLLSLWGRGVLDSPVWGAKALLWAFLIYIALALLPGAESLGYLFGKGVTGPLLSLFFLGLVGTAVQHFGSYSLRRYFISLAQTKRYHHQPRAHSRFITLRHAMEFGLRLVTGLVVVLVFLAVLDVDLATVATGAGLLGATITFVCQDMIRDFLAGLNILLEDQFVLGDQIEGAGTTGKVEAFTLRSTQVRCADGSLMCLPNSELRKVKNLTKDWSQVDFRILISNRQPLEPALQSLQSELEKLALDWPDKFLSEPELLGPEDIQPGGCSLRALLKTCPGEQFKVKRELNRRVKDRFEKDGIALAPPPLGETARA